MFERAHGHETDRATDKNHAISSFAFEVFMVSLVHKMGYSAAFKWISDILKQKSK